MIVIADASPLNYLVLIRESELLREMYGRVVVPERVVRELNSDATPSAVEIGGQLVVLHGPSRLLASAQSIHDPRWRIVMPRRGASTTGGGAVQRLIELGYERWDRGAEAGACEEWLKAWALLLKTIDETGLARLSEIDQALPGLASVRSWAPDLHMTLWNAGLREPRFIEEGVRFGEEFLRRFEADDLELTQDVRSALAAFHAKRGQFGTADALFRSWLTADPQWGWGWLRWAECYSFRPWENEQLAKQAVEILREGAAVPGVHDEKVLLADLESLLADLGRDQESRAVRRRSLALAVEGPEQHEPPPLYDWPTWLEADRAILDGYDRLEAGDRAGAARLWLAAWGSFLQAVDESGVEDLDDFDEQVSGYDYVSGWASRFANEVWDAAYEERLSTAAGLDFTTEFLRRFEMSERHATEEVRRVHGLLHARAGRLHDADALFGRWLAEEPRWGWGWIYWAACYTYAAPDGMSSDVRSIQILQRGATVPGLRDTRDVLEELADQLAFVGRKQEAEEVRRRRASLPEEEADAEELSELPTEPTSADPGLRESPSEGEPRRANKVGRNQPCPCGSGRKFKKCCGR